MQIQINDTFRIESDSRSWALQKLAIGKDKDGNKVERWDGLGYYANLSNAVEGYFNHRTKASEAKGFQEAVEEFKRIYREVQEIVARLDFKVELPIEV